MLALRKLHLQYLQVKYLKKSSSTSFRLEEQKKVLLTLLTKPYLLFSNSKVTSENESLDKYLNHLNMIVKNDRLYQSAKKTVSF